MRSNSLKFAAAIAALALPNTVTAQEPAEAVVADETIEPGAIDALSTMSAYLRTLPRFAISGQNSFEEVLETGQTLQYSATMDILIDRPSGMRLFQRNPRGDRDISFDGSSVTIYAPQLDFFATIEAPGTIAQMVRAAGDRYGIEIPLADFIAFDRDPELTAPIEAGFRVGTEQVGDLVCDHYAFRQPNVDWEIWIRRGDQPLPCKILITRTDIAERPQFSSILAWNLTPQIPENAFSFEPPEGVTRIAIRRLDTSDGDAQ